MQCRACRSTRFTSGHESKSYTPNSVPLEKRRANIASAIALVVYGLIALARNDLYFPLRKASRGIHFHDQSLWLIEVAIALAVISLLTVVADHYDRRDNESLYRQTEAWSRRFAIVLFFLALLMNLVSL
jgi:uncharacterized membrane protein